MDPQSLRRLLVRLVRDAAAPMAAHDLLDAVQAQAPAVDEATVLEHAVSLVAEGTFLVRADHGTVYFQAGSAPRS